MDDTPSRAGDDPAEQDLPTQHTLRALAAVHEELAHWKSRCARSAT